MDVISAGGSKVMNEESEVNDFFKDSESEAEANPVSTGEQEGGS